MQDPTGQEEKSERFGRLLELENTFSLKKHQAYVGRTVRALIDGVGRDGEGSLTARTNGGRLIHLKGDASLVGTYRTVRITEATTWSLQGEAED